MSLVFMMRRIRLDESCYFCFDPLFVLTTLNTDTARVNLVVHYEESVVETQKLFVDCQIFMPGL